MYLFQRLDTLQSKGRSIRQNLWLCRDCLRLWTDDDCMDKCVCGGDDWFKYTPDDEWNER